MNHWLFKSEPDTFGIDALAKAPKQTSAWDGVRNYQARNMLRDDMKKGDLAFLYYSSTDVPGIVAVMNIVKEGYPDPTAFERKHHHYDADSDPAKPRKLSDITVPEGTLSHKVRVDNGIMLVTE